MLTVKILKNSKPDYDYYCVIIFLHEKQLKVLKNDYNFVKRVIS